MYRHANQISWQSMVNKWSIKAPEGGHEEESNDSQGFKELPTADLHRPKDARATARCNLFARLFFTWMDPLYWTGCHRSLEQTDLYAHPGEADSEKLLKKFNRYWAQELERKRCGRSARLWWALMKCVWWRFLLQGVLLYTEMTLMLCQSVVLGYLANYFTIQEPSAKDTRDAYLFATGLTLMNLSIGLLHAHSYLMGQKVGMMARIVTTGAIYQKVLTLSQVTLGRISVGHVVNLASNDVQRFDLMFLHTHFFVVAPIHIMAFAVLTYLEIGWSALLGTALIILQIPLQMFMARVFGILRLKSAKVTDKRVKVMNEVISGIRVIKMYAWEYAFKRVVIILRRQESFLIFQGLLIRACNLGVTMVSVTVILFVMFSAYTATGGELTPKTVFTPLSLLLLLRISVVHNVVVGVLSLFDGKAGFSRIQKLLEIEDASGAIEEASCKVGMKTLSEVKTLEICKETIEGMSHLPETRIPDSQKQKGAWHVAIHNLSVSWSYEREKTELENISFEVDQDSPLLAVVGPVGAGKSTLLQCLLGELKPIDGCVDVQGRLSYASQDPWVFSGTLRDNILFGLPYQKTWYNTVIEACTLDKDIVSLIHGDLTLVGERGVTLSGGQKARVSLARAVYANADVYLLDDPLSAVDTAVARHLFERVIRGLLRDKCVVLVTHQLQFAQEADRILAIKDGKVEAYGGHEELVARGIDPTRLLGVKEKESDEFAYKVDEEEGSNEKDVSLPLHGYQKSTSMIELTENSLPLLNEPLIVNQSPSLQIPKKSSSMFHLENVTSNKSRSLLQLDNTPSTPICFEPSPLDALSIYTMPSLLSLQSSVEGRTKYEKGVKHAPPPEEKAHGSISMATYYHYLHSGGNYLFLIIVAVALVVGQTNIVAADWWLSDWASCNRFTLNASQNVSVRSTCTLSTDQRIGIYAALTASAVITNFARAILFMFLCVNASRVLHNRMFGAVLRAPVLFFDTNPIGRVLNRFSKDVGFLDDLMPYQFVECLLFLLMFAAVFMTAVISNVWILIPTTVLIVVFLFIRWYYLKSAREIKRLEAIARSPLYSHFSTTLQGLPTIRTFGNELIAIDTFHRYQNEHTQGWWLYLAGTRWLGTRFDVLSALFLAIVAFSSVQVASTLNPGLVGLALAYTISLAGEFQYTVRLSAEVENLMISAERLMDYGKLEPEAPLETLPPHKKLPPEWPDKGEIVMEDISFRYSDELPLVLKSLCFSVKPGEKIGIVGRTGAGKSSLIEVLFRMAEPFGVVTIDGVSTKEVGLHDLRKRMSIIPQDPVLFSGTVRYNLDPFGEYSDAKLWNALEQVQLKPAVEALEGQLEGEVTEGGSNFSVGQRQLMCLARALLRKNKILVLDEATANVDHKTDEVIQHTIREQFADCTVLTIAHRLNTVMDSNKILVLNKGKVREVGSPYTLLQDPQSQLKRMVDQTGPSASRKLHQMAQEAHLHRMGHIHSSSTERQGDSADPVAFLLPLIAVSETPV